MTDKEFDQSPPAQGKAQYRVQRMDCSWSDWFPIEYRITDGLILSVQVSEWVTKDQYREFPAATA